MAEEQESAAERPESQEKPLPEVPSVVSRAEQPSAAPALDADALKAELRETIRDEVSKAFQSGKDRRFADVERISQYLQSAGGNVEEAVQRMKLDEVYERIASEPVGGSTGRGVEGDKAFMEARSAQILRDANIAFDDPDYRVMVSQYQGRVTPDQWITLVQGLAESRTRKASKQESVTPAAAVGGGGSAAPAGNLEAWVAELMEIQAGQAGSLSDPKVKARRKELRALIAKETPQRPDIR